MNFAGRSELVEQTADSRKWLVAAILASTALCIALLTGDDYLAVVLALVACMTGMLGTFQARHAYDLSLPVIILLWIFFIPVPVINLLMFILFFRKASRVIQQASVYQQEELLKRTQTVPVPSMLPTSARNPDAPIPEAVPVRKNKELGIIEFPSADID